MITGETFENEVVKSKKPVVVGFSAPWCKYCAKLKPALGELAMEIDDKVDFAGVNIDDDEALARQFHIEVIPSLMLVSKGTYSELLVNPPTKEAVADWLKEKEFSKVFPFWLKKRPKRLPEGMECPFPFCIKGVM